MRRLITTLVLAASLAIAACTPPQSASDVAVAVDKVADRYAAAKAWAQLLLAFAPADKAAEVKAWITRGDDAITAAQSATTLAEKQAEARKLEDATRELEKASTL